MLTRHAAQKVQTSLTCVAFPFAFRFLYSYSSNPFYLSFPCFTQMCLRLSLRSTTLAKEEQVVQEFSPNKGEPLSLFTNSSQEDTHTLSLSLSQTHRSLKERNAFQSMPLFYSFALSLSFLFLVLYVWLVMLFCFVHLVCFKTHHARCINTQTYIEHKHTLKSFCNPPLSLFAWLESKSPWASLIHFRSFCERNADVKLKRQSTF